MNDLPWLHGGWATHKGRRNVNEDAVLVEGCLMAVADGVGGAPRGDLASAAAIEALHEEVNPPPDPASSSSVAEELADAVAMADEAVAALAARWWDLRGTATTVCAAVAFTRKDGRRAAIVANVGDSRCYHLGSEGIRQVTHDHTLAHQMELAGVGTPGARAHHIVTSVLGGSDETKAEIDLFDIDLDVGDSLVLCTDGISDALDPDRMVELVTTFNGDLNAAAAALVRAAWDAEATDNLTAIVASVSGSQGS